MRSMTNRQQRIQLLSRANAASLSIPSISSHTLSEALGDCIGQNALLGLRKTDALITVFRERYQRAVAEALTPTESSFGAAKSGWSMK